MKLFIDTADLQEIRSAASLGVIDGVTTNPTHIARVGRDRMGVARDILQIVDGPVSIEAVATEAGEIVEEARSIAAVDGRLVVKIPVNHEGLKAVRRLSSEGIKTNVTLVFSVNQAILAAKAGATYVSLFVNRLDVIGADGLEVVRQTVGVFRSYAYRTQIIAASVLNPRYVTECALCGVDVVTVPYAVFEKLIEHPMTEAGVKQFLQDWESVKGIQKPR